MIVTQRISEVAERAADRYAILVESWRSLYRAALDSPQFGTPRQMSDVVEQAYGIARAFLDNERDMVEERSWEIASHAHRQTSVELGSVTPDDLAAPAGEHLSEAESYLMHELGVQVERDIAFLKQSLRRSYLQVSISARSRRIPQRQALMEYRIGNATELHFFFHDRGNRKWPSRKAVRTLWRHHLLSLYNEVVLMTLADHGLEIAEVVHASPDAAINGFRVAMSSSTAHPTYSEIRDEFFHPNADAVLKHTGD